MKKKFKGQETKRNETRKNLRNETKKKRFLILLWTFFCFFQKCFFDV
jgi:hypothetical protein